MTRRLNTSERGAGTLNKPQVPQEEGRLVCEGQQWQPCTATDRSRKGFAGSALELTGSSHPHSGPASPVSLKEFNRQPGQQSEGAFVAATQEALAIAVRRVFWLYSIWKFHTSSQKSQGLENHFHPCSHGTEARQISKGDAILKRQLGPVSAEEALTDASPVMAKSL